MRADRAGRVSDAARRGPGLDVTVTSSAGTVATLKTQAGSGAARTVHLSPNESASATTLTNPTGLAIDPLNPGTTVLRVSAPGFAPLPTGGHTLTVTATGITVFSSVFGQGFPYAVGAAADVRVPARRYSTSWGRRGYLQQQPGAAKCGGERDDGRYGLRQRPVAPGLSDGSFVVQGLGVGIVTLELSAPGFQTSTSGEIQVHETLVRATERTRIHRRYRRDPSLPSCGRLLELPARCTG